MPSNDSSRFRISVVQLVASALAAVTAAIAGSFLGVNGTVIGAAIASVLSVAGTAIYSHSLRRTGDRVRSAVPATTRWLPERAPTMPLLPVPPAGLPPAVPVVVPPPAQRRLHPAARLTAAAVIVFAAALGLLTGAELIAGRPVSDLVSGQTANGTTVFGSQAGAGGVTPTAPAVTVTVTPRVVVTTPTVTHTAPAVTVTTAPASPTGSGAPTVPTGTPASNPAGSGTPTNTTLP